MKISPHEIGFDLDGVIADTAATFIRLACEEHNYCSFNLKDITSFQVEDCLDIPTSLVDGGSGLVTDPQDHPISTIQVVEGQCGAAGGHNAGVDVELLGGIKRLHFRRRG